MSSPKMMTQGPHRFAPDCFHDEGLRLTSAEIGQKDMSGCLNCGSQNSMKLTSKHVAFLAQRFFVRGKHTQTYLRRISSRCSSIHTSPHQ